MHHKTNGPSSAEKEATMIYDNLDEWLNDENKIITYRWLSLTLGLHVNHAKQVLESFVTQQQNKGCPLSVTYCLGGLVAIGNAQVYKVVIVNEDQRKSIESTFLPPISCHIYSIQKSLLKSSDVLFTADFDLIKSSGYDANKHSAIRCQHANLRTQKPKTEPTNSNASLPPPTVKNSAALSSPAPTSNILSKKTTPDTSKPVSAETRKQVVEKSVHKSNSGFSKLFAGAVARPKVDSSTSKTPKDHDLDTPAANSEASGDASSSKNSKSTPEATCTSSKSKKLDNSSAKNSKSAPPHSRAPAVKKVSVSSNKETMSKQQNIKKETDSEKGKTKRRRIVVESSSSEDEEEVVISPTPSPEPLRTPAEPQEDMQPEPMDVGEVTAPVKDSLSQQNVQRKLVSKTYVNDEGFMVTEKVWETEPIIDDQKSAVDSSTPAPSSASNTKPATASKQATMSTATLSAASNSGPAKKKAPEKKAPTKTTSGKQASLMNFFQKK